MLLGGGAEGQQRLPDLWEGSRRGAAHTAVGVLPCDSCCCCCCGLCPLCCLVPTDLHLQVMAGLKYHIKQRVDQALDVACIKLSLGGHQPVRWAWQEWVWVVAADGNSSR